jgi:acetyl-CoA carboxylase carboxyl transferase subunit alpha
MIMSILEFERPIYELESKINELRSFSSDKNITLGPEIKKLAEKMEKMKREIYNNLTAWQRVQIARHTERPYTLDYIRLMTTDFVELHGDRQFADDLALVAGFVHLNGTKAVILGHQKGRDTKENVMRNFGCAHPEGYRKAMRLMQLAEKFRLPVVILIDTPGAYPGVGAEERGQAQAIAENLRDMVQLKTPIVATIIGEGGSGGALGIGVADRVCILQHAYYSVISPEGCASILWRNAVKAPQAAEALKITADHLLKFGIVDEIVPEPLGGAHQDPLKMASTLKGVILKHIKELSALSHADLLTQRYNKFRKIGEYAQA